MSIMPHIRKRYANASISKSLSHSGIVGLFGQRQVGKTTLMVELAKEYKTFDTPGNLEMAESAPEEFIAGRKHPFGIDEAQLSPSLFPVLKEYVRLNKKPGQFLLTGSIRFTSRQVIRESLTGRIVGIEVLPFTIAEANERQMPQPLNELLKIKSSRALSVLIEKRKSSEKEFHDYLERGGLPGIAFYRDAQVRSQRFEFQIDTILNRDYKLVHNTSLPASSIRDLLQYLAIHQGECFDQKTACEYSQISKVTIKKVLDTLHALFLIRELPPHPSSGERKKGYFLEDQGMASWLTQGHLHSANHHFIRGLYSNLRQELFYQIGDPKKITFYRNKNGVNVPLVFELHGRNVGIIVSSDKIPTPKIYSAATSFTKSVRGSIAIVASSNSTPRFISQNIFEVPYWKLV